VEVINLGDDDDDEDDTTVLFVNGLDAFVLILILILEVLFIGFTASSDDDDDESVDGITVVGVVLLLVRSGDHNLRNGWNGKDDKYDRRHT
jgi:hypothetical protein